MRAVMMAGVMALAMGSHAAHADYIYVGRWTLGDGPVWSGGPAPYTGQSVAALLFGGAVGDYAISTLGSDSASINHQAWYDAYASIIDTHAEDGAANPSGSGRYSTKGDLSAYVLDNSCYNRYSDLNQSCTGYGSQFVNYAFRLKATAVPEPATLALLGASLSVVLLARRRR